jgi:hypothetical protein
MTFQNLLPGDSKIHKPTKPLKTKHLETVFIAQGIKKFPIQNILTLFAQKH